MSARPRTPKQESTEKTLALTSAEAEVTSQRTCCSKTHGGDAVSEASAGCSSLNKVSKKMPPINMDMQKWFQQVDTRALGKITAKELQHAFETFQGKHFSDSVCKFVVRLFDLDKNGGLDIREFEQLYSYVKQWVNAFNAYDRGRSGFLDENEFAYALSHMDINFSPEFIKFLVTRNDPDNKKISMDQFIVTCVQIQRFTEEFKNRDQNFAGSIQLKYEDFLEMVLKCFIAAQVKVAKEVVPTT